MIKNRLWLNTTTYYQQSEIPSIKQMPYSVWKSVTALFEIDKRIKALFFGANMLICLLDFIHQLNRRLFA